MNPRLRQPWLVMIVPAVLALILVAESWRDLSSVDAKEKTPLWISPTPVMNFPGRGIEIEDAMGVFTFRTKEETRYECGFIEFQSDHSFTFVKHVDVNQDRLTDSFEVIKGLYEVARREDSSPGFLLKPEGKESSFLENTAFEGMALSSFTFDSISFRRKGPDDPLFDWSGDTAELAGGLKVETVPEGASVYVDGLRAQGTGPVEIKDLAANVEHSVRAEFPGYAPSTVQVTLAKEESRLIRIELAKAGASGLTVDADPRSVVLLDGDKLGWTPLHRDDLPAGDHVLTLINYSFNLAHTQGIKLEAGKTVDVKKFYTGALTLDVGRRAAVYLRKKKIGVAPFQNLVVPVGRHKLEVVDEKMREAALFVTVLPDQTTTVKSSPVFRKPSNP